MSYSLVYVSMHERIVGKKNVLGFNFSFLFVFYSGRGGSLSTSTVNYFVNFYLFINMMIFIPTESQFKMIINHFSIFRFFGSLNKLFISLYLFMFLFLCLCFCHLKIECNVMLCKIDFLCPYTQIRSLNSEIENGNISKSMELN